MPPLSNTKEKHISHELINTDVFLCEKFEIRKDLWTVILHQLLDFTGLGIKFKY